MFTQILQTSCAHWTFWIALLCAFAICLLDLYHAEKWYYVLLYQDPTTQRKGYVLSIVFLISWLWPYFSGEIPEASALIIRLAAIYVLCLLFKLLCLGIILALWLWILWHPYKWF